MTTKNDLYADLLAGRRTSVRGSCEGFDFGTFRPIRYDSGAIGWQATDDATGALLGCLDRNGLYGQPGGGRNCTWEICPITKAHLDALRAAAAPWEACPMEWT